MPPLTLKQIKNTVILHIAALRDSIKAVKDPTMLAEIRHSIAQQEERISQLEKEISKFTWHTSREGRDEVITRIERQLRDNLGYRIGYYGRMPPPLTKNKPVQ